MSVESIEEDKEEDDVNGEPEGAWRADMMASYDGMKIASGAATASTPENVNDNEYGNE